MSIFRCLRTLRHLRWSQVIGQVRVRLAKSLRNPGKVRGKNWELGQVISSAGIPDPVPPQSADNLSRGRFSFIGRKHDFGPQVDWEAPGQLRLWQYNLHYFDWLWSLLGEKNEDAHWDTAKTLTLDWFAHHSASRSACGWEPYPVSLRLLNWSLLYGVRYREEVKQDPGFRGKLLESLGQQVGWLERNLETHIQANHLLENVAALTCVALVFDGPDRTRLHDRMIPMLRDQLREQILPDGMHYERSPMYHLRVLWLLEVLSRISDEEVGRMARQPLAAMKRALGCLRHPDGGIALLNDAAIGIYQDSWRGENGPGPWSLPDAGYYGFRNLKGDYLIADAGAIGPNHQPGHAHADLLGFELSLSGHRAITDSGVGTYKAGKQRSFDRSTAAHSTVEVAGRDSVEVWGGFRVGRRTVPTVLRWEPGEEGVLLEAEHAGYRHLPSRARHRRVFQWEADQLIIRDRIFARRQVEIASRIHLAPEVEARLKGHTVICRIAGVPFALDFEGPGDLSLEESMAFTRFGRGHKRQVIVVRANVTPPSWESVWRITKR